MPISYTKQGWTNNSPPAINAAHLGAMDDGIKQACDGVDALNVAPVAHATSHKHGGSDEVATATPTANAIPKADASGKLDSWISDASTSVKGKVQLATSTEFETGTDASKVLTPAVVRPAIIKRSKMPDGATAAYSQDAWGSTDGWSVYNGTLSTTTTPGWLRVTASADNTPYYIVKFVTGVDAQQMMYRIRASKTMTIFFTTGTSDNVGYTVGTNPVTIAMQRGKGGKLSVEVLSNIVAGDWFEIDWVWIGNLSFQDGSAVDAAVASLNALANVYSNTFATDTLATATITSDGSAPTSGKIITIGEYTYTLVDTLTGTEGQILFNSNAATTLQNFAYGINADAGQYNVTHCCTVANPLVSAVAASLVLTLTSKIRGELGNQIKVSTTETTYTKSGSYLSGGCSIGAKRFATLVAPIIAGRGTRPAAAMIDITDTSKIGYENAEDKSVGQTLTLPSGGTRLWFVYGYGATINSAKRGSSAGGTTLTVSGANATVWYRRYA